MNRRDFLKAAMGTVGGLIVARSGLVLAQTAGNAQAFIHPTLASRSRDPVGARLVCSIDVSGSVDNAEYEVEIKGVADAIESEDFRHAVFFKGGPESIAICVTDFGSTAALLIPWVDFRKGDDEKFKAFAEEIRNLPRRESGSTNHIAELQLAGTCFENCPWPGKRNIVDSLTDGSHNTGGDVYPWVAELARKHNATVNALAIMSEPNLDEWCRENLITKPGFFKSDGSVLEPGFVKIVASQQTTNNPGATVEYHKAMDLAFRRKLIMEVAGLELEELRRLAKLEKAAGGLGSRIIRPDGLGLSL